MLVVNNFLRILPPCVTIRRMLTGFEKASFLQSVTKFKECLEDGVDHSTQDLFGRTPMFGLRFCVEASVDDFVDVLHAFVRVGADINHIDSFGDTLLLVSQNDNLGAALVRVGANISYELPEYSKRGLANAAMYGCTRTIDEMVRSRLHRPDRIRQSQLDSCLDQAAKILAYNPAMCDMTGIVKLVVDYGANPNTWNTLHYSVKRNHVLVRTLISLGTRCHTRAWDFTRGVKNTPLHRIVDMVSFDVFEALVQPDTDFNARDSSGATPLMAMMKTLLHPDKVMLDKMSWLIERGASCLPVDKKGKRVSALIRSKDSPFKEFIAARIREENWMKRRGIVLMRHWLVYGIRKKRGRHGTPTLVEKVASFPIEGVFRHVVTFL